MIKSKLNEFEADWAAMPRVEKEQLAKLRNKTLLISGHSIARCLCIALLYLNETQKLNINLIYCGDGVIETERRFFLSDRRDIICCDYDSFSELSKHFHHIDAVIHTGVCCEPLPSFAESLPREINAAKAVCEAARKNNAEMILLSDSRVYGKAHRGRVYAENEYAENDALDCSCAESQLVRTIENYFCCEAKQSGFTLTTLRTGIVLGACAGLRTFLDDALQAVANGEPYTLPASDRRYSFVYLTDVFRAIVYALTTLERGQTYNVTGAESTVSVGMIAAVLCDVYGDKAKLTLGDTCDYPYCAVSNGKIFTYGCPPAMNLTTALELCVMSRMHDLTDLKLPNTHDGRLDAIQQMQLAYLLEVDRICRKHNIKYFLGGGTLLGAIRHHGFIPWDDDADIMMLREDYDKFADIAASELPANMTFQSGKTDRSCFYEFNKLRIEGTVFATELAKEHRSINIGIAFDIFCHDKTANSKLGRKLHLAATVFTRALVLNKWNKRKVDNGSRIQSAVTNFFVKLFPLRFSYFLMNHTISFFKRKKNAKYLYDGMGRNVYNGSFDAHILDEVIYVDFEDCQLPVPKRYDEYLRFLYGDYMEPAPLSTRLGCHEILLCDIGKYDALNAKATPHT